MGRNYIHALIVLLWIILDFRWSLKTLFIPGTLSDNVIILAAYVFVAIWFIMARRRDYVISKCVKLLAFFGMVYSFFIMFGIACYIFKLPELTKTTPIYIKISNIISYDFIIVFMATIVVSPLAISIFNKHFMYISLAIATPTFCFNPYINFSTISKSSYTIGVFSARYLAVIVATYLSSVILTRLSWTETSNKGLVTDAANDAAPHNP